MYYKSIYKTKKMSSYWKLPQFTKYMFVAFTNALTNSFNHLTFLPNLEISAIMNPGKLTNFQLGEGESNGKDPMV